MHLCFSCFRFWWWLVFLPVEKPRGLLNTLKKIQTRSTTSLARTPSWTKWRSLLTTVLTLGKNHGPSHECSGFKSCLFAAQVMGLRRQRNYAGRWDVLIQQATQCLNRLIEIAARKRRNYILDQVLLLFLYSVLILTTVSQCALMITFSNGLFIYLSGGLCVL